MIYRAVVAAKLPRIISRWRDAAVVFSYHNVIPDGAARGERVLHVPKSRFREQIERIAQRFQVVPVQELLQRRQDAKSLRGLAAITFDDAYRGVLRHALPVLAEYALPATVFVITSALERARPFWWDVLADRAGGAVPERERLLTDLGGDESVILAASPSPWDDVYLPASGAELESVDSSVTFGPHTITHPNLTRMSTIRASGEIGGSWRALQERFENVIPVVAYPYGRANPETARVAQAMGLSGFADKRAALTRDSDLGRLPRLFVGPDTSGDALEVTAAGLMLA